MRVPETVTQGIDSIFQNIGKYLTHKLLISEKDHPVIIQTDVNPAAYRLYVRHQRLKYVIQHGLELERMYLGHRYAGQGSVTVDKAQQTAGGLSDDLYPLADIAVFGHTQQCIAQGDYRSDGIEHLVRDDAGHFLPLGILLRPGLRGLIRFLLKDIHPHRRLSIHHCPAFHRHVEQPELRPHMQFHRASVLQCLQARGHSGHNPVQISDIADSIDPEHLPDNTIDASDLTARRDSHKPGARQALHRLMKSLAILPQPLLLRNEVPHPIEQDVENPVLKIRGVLREMKCQVSVLERAEQVIEFPDIAGIQDNQPVDQKQHGCHRGRSHPVHPVDDQPHSRSCRDNQQHCEYYKISKTHGNIVYSPYLRSLLYRV